MSDEEGKAEPKRRRRSRRGRRRKPRGSEEKSSATASPESGGEAKTERRAPPGSRSRQRRDRSRRDGARKKPAREPAAERGARPVGGEGGSASAPSPVAVRTGQGGEPPQGDAPTSEEEERASKWWVDFGDKEEARQSAPVAPVVPVGQKFYTAAKGFEQEAARKRLTDHNLKLLVEANPAEGEWGYVQLAEKPFPADDAARIRDALELPSYARGALIDSGRSVRLLVTGTPIGERILELALAREPSFDCWIQGEWVKEAVFKDRKRALRAFKGFVEHYLSPEGIETWERIRARA